MLFNPLSPVVVCHFQVEVHLLLQHGALAAGDTFVKQQLRLHLRHRTALNGRRVRNNGVQIELLKVNLIRNAQRLMLLEQTQQYVLVLLRHIACKDTHFLK